MAWGMIGDGGYGVDWEETSGLSASYLALGSNPCVLVSDLTPPSSLWERDSLAGELTYACGLLDVWFTKYLYIFANI